MTIYISAYPAARAPIVSCVGGIEIFLGNLLHQFLKLERGLETLERRPSHRSVQSCWARSVSKVAGSNEADRGAASQFTAEEGPQERGGSVAAHVSASNFCCASARRARGRMWGLLLSRGGDAIFGPLFAPSPRVRLGARVGT